MTEHSLFTELVGNIIGFYGVDNNAFKLGRHVFEAMEDPCDGYRSYLGSVEIKDPTGLIFFNRPIGHVTVEEDREGALDGYKLVDRKDGHVWLRFGTDKSDGYYPYFVFQYTPK